MLPAGVHTTLESHAAPARRRLLAAKKPVPNPAVSPLRDTLPRS